MKSRGLIFKEGIRISSLLLSLILNCCIISVYILFLSIRVSCWLLLCWPRSDWLSSFWSQCFPWLIFSSENLSTGNSSTGFCLMCLIWIYRSCHWYWSVITKTMFRVDSYYIISFACDIVILFWEINTSVDVSCALMAFFRNVNKSGRFSLIGVKHSVINKCPVLINWVIYTALEVIQWANSL